MGRSGYYPKGARTREKGYKGKTGWKGSQWVKQGDRGAAACDAVVVAVVVSADAAVQLPKIRLTAKTKPAEVQATNDVQNEISFLFMKLWIWSCVHVCV